MQLSPNLFSSETLSSIGGALGSSPGEPGATVTGGGVAGATTNFVHWLGKAFPKIMWVIVLFRVAGYCAKNYFMINRQARKRTTTYAGKHAAFSAELETAEMLKTTKDKK
jgi:hypothetical protein